MVRTDLATLLAALGARMGERGLSVAPGRLALLAEAIVAVEPATSSQLYWCARATLLGDISDLASFDAAFWEAFGSEGSLPPLPPASAEHVAAKGSPAPAGDVHRYPRGEAKANPGRGVSSWGCDRGGTDGPRQHHPALASGAEVLRSKEFSELTAEDLAAGRRFMEDLARAVPWRKSLAFAYSDTSGAVDLRTTLKQAGRRGEYPAKWSRRNRQRKRRRLVILVDISGSMEPYALAYMQLAHCAASVAKAEAFTFATRLSRVTPALVDSGPAQALRKVAKAAPDWSSGTRIGDALKVFLDDYGRRGLARGAVVVVVSDGWERGDPARLGEQMDRLARLAHRIVWVNPRKAGVGYEPSVAGMTAALPHCDAFVSGHNYASLGELALAISGT